MSSNSDVGVGLARLRIRRKGRDIRFTSSRDMGKMGRDGRRRQGESSAGVRKPRVGGYERPFTVTISRGVRPKYLYSWRHVCLNGPEVRGLC